MNTTSAVEKREKAVEFVADGIKVRETYPDNVNDTIRQQKWGKMYDIFQPASRQCNCAWAEQKKQLNDLAICRKRLQL